MSVSRISSIPTHLIGCYILPSGLPFVGDEVPFPYDFRKRFNAVRNEAGWVVNDTFVFGFPSAIEMILEQQLVQCDSFDGYNREYLYSDDNELVGIRKTK